MKAVGLAALTTLMLATIAGGASAQTLPIVTPGILPLSSGASSDFRQTSTPASRTQSFTSDRSVDRTSCSLACAGYVLLGVGY